MFTIISWHLEYEDYKTIYADKGKKVFTNLTCKQIMKLLNTELVNRGQMESAYYRTSYVTDKQVARFIGHI